MLSSTFHFLFVCSRNLNLCLLLHNQYNFALYELVDYVQNVENYLAKSMITSTPEHGAETLSKVWREANLAQAYLAMLPLENISVSRISHPEERLQTGEIILSAIRTDEQQKKIDELERILNETR